MSNSLGIGTTGKTYNLVPNSIGIPFTCFKNKQFQEHCKKKNRITPHSKLATTRNNTIYDKNIDNNVEQSNVMGSGQHQDMGQTPGQHQDMGQTPDPESDTDHEIKEQNLKIEESYLKWNQMFLNVCSNQLYGCFRKIKEKIHKSDIFNDTKLCYININSMKLLITKAKQENAPNGLMSLKTYVISVTQSLVSPDEIEDYLSLINILEIMGPSDHIIICLGDEQITHLKTHNCQELFWPRKNEGITWIYFPIL